MPMYQGAKRGPKPGKGKGKSGMKPKPMGGKKRVPEPIAA
jgi:hypothetical protein